MDFDWRAEKKDGLRCLNGDILIVVCGGKGYSLDYIYGKYDPWHTHDVSHVEWHSFINPKIFPAEGREEYVERWVARKRLQFPGLDICVISKDEEEEGEYDDECRQDSES